MFPMIIALLIAIGAGGGAAPGPPTLLPRDPSHLPETRQEHLLDRQMAQKEALHRAPGEGLPASNHAGEVGDRALAATGPGSDAALDPEGSPRAFPALSSTNALTLTQTISDVLKLADDALVPGESYRGLLAKLEAADQALARGQAQVARHILDAFHNQLNALQRSGHITAQNYDDLRSRYAALVASLGGTPRAGTEPHGRSESGAGAAAAASPSHGGEGRKAGQPNPRPSQDKLPKRR